jgi:hypothetical protein
MFCTRCGANNLDGDQFCRSCSAPLTKTAGAQTPGVSSGSPQQQYPYSNPGPGQQQQPPQSYNPYPDYQQGYSPGQYGYANPGYAQPAQAGASGRSIASMVMSIVSIFTCGPFLSIPGMILGKMEMNAIRQGQAAQAGENFAKAGFYVGLVVTILSCLVGLGYILLIFLSAATTSSFDY